MTQIPHHVQAWRRTRSDTSRERLLSTWYDREWTITIAGQPLRGKLVEIEELAFVTNQSEPVFAIEIEVDPFSILVVSPCQHRKFSKSRCNGAKRGHRWTSNYLIT